MIGLVAGIITLHPNIAQADREERWQITSFHLLGALLVLGLVFQATLPAHAVTFDPVGVLNSNTTVGRSNYSPSIAVDAAGTRVAVWGVR